MTTAPKHLSAKALKYNITLEKHLKDTEEAARRLFGHGSRLAQSWWRFFRIPKDQEPRALLHLQVAGLFHDIGKANQDFLDRVSGKPKDQLVRHEHLGALLLHSPSIKSWLTKNPAIDHDVVSAAVLSHHIRADRGGDWSWCKVPGNFASRRVPTYFDHPEVIRVLEYLRGLLRITDPIPALPTDPYGGCPPWDAWLNQASKAAERFNREVRTNKESLTERTSLLLSTKAGLIVADAAASGLTRTERDYKWLDEIASLPPLSSTHIQNAILNKRIRSIQDSTKKPFVYQDFQNETEGLSSRALLLAACGAGKTLAAWRWAAAQAGRSSIGRVIFLYPTRGTATEGFRDYVGWAPEDEAQLVHGSATFELEEIAQNPEDKTPSAHGKKYQLSEADSRLFSLGLWPRRYFSATVDQFLGFMEHDYGGLCLLPALADSLVIIDEVHSFSLHMFDVLLHFLRTFDVPVLCMTATLPPDRQERLKNAGLEIYPSEAQRERFIELKKGEEHPRYRVHRISSEDQALQMAIAAYREKPCRVLWVVNQVARAQRLTRSLSELLGQPVRCYHSRFRLVDRQRIHRATVADFMAKDNPKPTIAVTTQVCEMSLDLDADVLFTEEAPISSLVQRFGRANRHLQRKDQNFRAAVYVYPPQQARPYDKEDLEHTSAFLDEISDGREINQKDLARLLEEHARREPISDGWSRFLHEGYYATPGDFRDADGYSQPCILQKDLAAAETALRNRKPIDGLVLPAPRRSPGVQYDRGDWMPRYLAIADDTYYDEELGFLMGEER